MTDFPRMCLSLKQPQPYFLFHLAPEYRCCVINREKGPSPFRGWVWIRAAKKPYRPEFYRWLELAEQAFVPGSEMPALSNLPFKGIVGKVRIVDVYPPGEQRDRWHDPTKYGYVVADATRVPFIECDGDRGLFALPEPVLEQLRRAEA